MKNTNEKNSSKGIWNIALWVVQLAVGGMFLMAGIMKTTQPIEKLHAMMSWTLAVSPWMVRVIGFFELMGAIGILLPTLLKIKPMLTPLAAAGLALVQICAFVFHMVRSENQFLGMNILLAILALFVAWGRSTKAPVQPKPAISQL